MAAATFLMAACSSGGAATSAPVVGATQGGVANAGSATVQLGGETYEFATVKGACTVDAGLNAPVIVSFKEADSKLDLLARNPEQRARIDLWFGDAKWTNVSAPMPEISGSTATWSSVELGKLEGGDPSVQSADASITVTC